MFKFHRAPELTDASAGKNASPLSLSRLTVSGQCSAVRMTLVSAPGIPIPDKQETGVNSHQCIGLMLQTLARTMQCNDLKLEHLNGGNCLNPQL